MAPEFTLNTGSFELRLLGPPVIQGPEGILKGSVVQRHRLALLALLAGAREHTLSRDSLLAMLWPESDTAGARNLLSVALHSVRKALGEDVLVTEGHAIHLDPRMLAVDVLQFESAVAQRAAGRAIELYAGPFMDGFSLPGAVEFERWQEQERDRLERLYLSALEQQAEAAVDPLEAVTWWRKRLAGSPAEARIVLKLMRALERSGDRAGALQLASAHALLLQEEFGAAPDASVVALARELKQAGSTPGPLTVHQSGGVSPASSSTAAGAETVTGQETITPMTEGAAVVRPPDEPYTRAGRHHPVRITARSRLYIAAFAGTAALAAGAAVLLRASREGAGVDRPEALDIAESSAYARWLRGTVHAARRRSGDIELCTEYARAAIAADSTFAPGYELLARCYNFMSFLAPSDPFPLFASAKAAAQRALELDPDLVQARASLAYAIAHHDWDWARAETIFRDALELSPGDAVILQDLAWLLSWNGRFDEALKHARLAQQLNPLSPQTTLRLSMILNLARRHEEARAEALRAIELDSSFMFAYDRLYWALHGMRQHVDAVAVAERAVALAGPRDIRRRAFLAHAYGMAGRRAEAEAILAELLLLEERSYVPPTAIAAAYVGLGDTDRALAWLERGFAQKDGGMVLLATFSLWDPLREHPGFHDLLRRMRFTVEP